MRIIDWSSDVCSSDLPLFISLFSLTCFSFQTEAQILKKLGDKIGRSLEKSSEAEADADASPIRKRLPADFELELTGSGPDMYMERLEERRVGDECDRK